MNETDTTLPSDHTSSSSSSSMTQPDHSPSLNNNSVDVDRKRKWWQRRVGATNTHTYNDSYGNSVLAPTPPASPSQSPSPSPTLPSPIEVAITASPNYVSSDSDDQTETQRRKRTVRFAPLVMKKAIKHHKDYTEEEFFATWLSQAELSDILQHCVLTVKRTVRGLSVEEHDGYCIRGLEYKTPSGSKSRKANKSQGCQAVLEEQTRQREKGLKQPARLAKVYREATKHVYRPCRLMAQSDEAVAQRIYHIDDDVEGIHEEERRGGSLNDGGEMLPMTTIVEAPVKFVMTRPPSPPAHDFCPVFRPTPLIYCPNVGWVSPFNRQKSQQQ